MILKLSSSPKLGIIIEEHFKGTLLVNKWDIKSGNANCTVKQPYSWSGWGCDKTYDQDYTYNSFWYTVYWKGAIGTWINIELPKYILNLIS